MKNKATFLFLIFISIFGTVSTLARENNLQLLLIAQGLKTPLFATAAKGDGRLFIVEQYGVISVLENGERYNVLDISEKVTFFGEAGLLGLALHPDFLTNGLAYVSYTKGSLVSIIEEYRYDEKNRIFDKSSAREIYSIKQPAANHNGGMVAFGPDGYLYIGLGDGGGANDTYKTGQDFNNPLGTIVRIDVGSEISTPFKIPPDNPQTNGLAPEAWIYGLRNPWRFSFDNELLYIGDVGQDAQEEVHVIQAGAASSGANLGWPLAEGDQCLLDKSCKEKDLVWPVITYPTSIGCAITGGYVYRGKAIPELVGHYFYGDFCNGEISSFKYENGKVSDQKNWVDILGKVEMLSSFAIDGFGELYVISLGGSIYRLENKI